MKNWWKVRYYLFLVALLVLCPTIRANVKSAYYTSVIKGWGLTTNDFETGGMVVDKYNLVLSSTYRNISQDITHNKNLKLIVVCDTPIKIRDVMCDSNAIVTESTSTLVKVKNTNIGLINTPDFPYTLILSEGTFIDPNSAISLGAYINAIYKSEPVSNSPEDVNNNMNDYNRITYFLFLSCIVFIISILLANISFIRNHSISSLINSLYNHLIIVKRIIYDLLIGLLLLPIPPIIALILVSIVKQNNLLISFVTNTTTAVFILVYFSAIILTFGAFLIINKQAVYSYLLRFKYIKFKRHNVKRLVFIGLIFFAFILPYLPPIDALVLSCFLSALLMVITTFNKNIATIGNKLKLTIIITLYIGVFYTSYSIRNTVMATKETIEKNYQSLFTQNRLIKLPYYKNIEKNTRMLPYNKQVSYRLFVNEFLIFDPIYNRIVYKPFTDIDTSKAGLVLFPKSREIYTKYLLKATNKELFIQRNMSQIFSVEKDLSDHNTDIEITFDCSIERVPQEIKFIMTDSDKDQSKKLFVMNFPGCSKDSVTIYKTKFNLYNNAIYTIDNFNELGITSVKAFLYDEPVKLTFYRFRDKFNKRFVIQNTNSAAGTLNYYSLEHTNITLDRPEINYDISKPVNYLIENNLIYGETEIWSDTDNVLLNETL